MFRSISKFSPKNLDILTRGLPAFLHKSLFLYDINHFSQALTVNPEFGYTVVGWVAVLGLEQEGVVHDGRTAPCFSGQVPFGCQMGRNGVRNREMERGIELVFTDY